MTRAEAEQHIREIKRSCRGPLVLSAMQRDMFAKRGEAALQSGNVSAALVLKRELEIILGVDNKPLKSLPEITQRLVELIYSYADINPGKFGPSCGYDFNNTVVSGPWDGQLRDYVCPKCGQTGQYIPPVFPDLED